MFPWISSIFISNISENFGGVVVETKTSEQKTE